MHVAILGGGITGLTTALELAKKGYSVTLFERDSVFGGLAQGFIAPGWKWPLERAYHHLFFTDTDIRSFCRENDIEEPFFTEPRTDSLYTVNGISKIYPVDSPLDFLRFPLLSPITKLRGVCGLAFLILTPFLTVYQRLTAEQFVKRVMGQEMWNVFFRSLFRKKFGKYAGKILASFLWARIHKRTKKLGYFKGGFQQFVNNIISKIPHDKAVLLSNTEIKSIEKVGDYFRITYQAQQKGVRDESFDAVISTLPSKILEKVQKNLFPQRYVSSFDRLSYLHALVFILETKEPLLEKTYWLNICDPDINLMFVGQHTNFISKKYYGGKHIAYVGFYLDAQDPLWTQSEKDSYDMVCDSLEKITSKRVSVDRWFSFRGFFAQPIFDKAFVQNKPTFHTPCPRFYVANLDMTYPYDRGTNYAVALGKEVSTIISNELPR